MTAPRDTDARMLAALKAHGFGAMSFSALEPGMRHWFSEADPGAAVAYVDTGSAWVAAGGPIADSTTASRVGREFVAAARRQGRRACFFAVERASLEGFSYVLLGEQPIWTPSAWPDTLARHRRLREQVRRGAGKRVRVRRVTAGDLAPGTPLRKRCDAVAGAWLASRHMAPMTFVVALEPFVCPEEHRYFVAERDGDIVAFLSAVPIYAKQGWLVEDLLRVRGAPNGTVEALIDALMREVADSAVVTLGLAPLAGPVNPWLRIARMAGRPLYDFRGLQRFKERLRPASWQPVWLAYPETDLAVVHVADSLRAFAGGSLLRFGWRTLFLHPGATPWALALPLIPWTALLAALAVGGRSHLLGFSTWALFGWVLFDALLLVQLLLSAMRPRPARLAAAAVPAFGDAVLSVMNVAAQGFGRSVLAVSLRAVATLAPCMGTVVLAVAIVQSLRHRSGARPLQRTSA